MSKKSNNYIDNKEFYAEMVEYIKECEIATSNEQSRPNPSDSICLKIMAICNNLSKRHNFSGYPYKDIMVGDAIENCIRYIDRFNYVKYNSPYAYFTTIAWQSFVNRINQEKQEFRKKIKYIHNLSVDQVFSDLQDHDNAEDFDNDYVKFLQENYLADQASDGDLLSTKKIKPTPLEKSVMKEFFDE